MELTIKVICEDMPGGEGVYLGIQRGEEVVETVPATRKRVVFEPAFRVAPLGDGRTNFLGPYAKGTPTERFFYLCWLAEDASGMRRGFRRAKIHLTHLPWEVVEAGKPISVTLRMTDKQGEPICASIKQGISWSV